MLPPSYLDQMPDAFVALWRQVEDEILPVSYTHLTLPTNREV